MAASGKGTKPVVAVLGGAGAMGRAVVFDLARSGHPVLLLDADSTAGRRVARRYGARRTVVEAVEARDAVGLASRLFASRARVIVNCAPYSFNLPVMEAALRARCHYLDLGGLFHTTRRQLRRHADFRRRGLLAALGMGSAPGIVNVLARAAAQGLRRVHSIKVYNGGADFTRYETPLAFPFSPATMLDELTLPPMVFRQGRFRRVAPLSGGEDFLFDVGRQRVHYSLHSEVATLPLSFRDRGIRDCAFKIAYDPELLNQLRQLIDLGLASCEPGPQGVSPRDVLLACFRRLPPPPDFIDDRDSLAVVVEGEDRRGALAVRCDLTAGPQRRPPLSAVARDTGFPAAIVARMVLCGAIRERGVLPPERCVPVRPFLRALAERGMPARVAVSR